MVGVVGAAYEKVEKKKILLLRAQEIQIKSTVETLQAVIKLFTKSIHFHNEESNKYMKSVESFYLNGSVHDFIAFNYTML